METVNTQFEELKALVTSIEEDMPKLEKGVKKSARRIRKNLSAIQKLCKPLRAEVLDVVKEEE